MNYLKLAVKINKKPLKNFSGSIFLMDNVIYICLYSISICFSISL